MQLVGITKTYEGEYVAGYNAEYINKAGEKKVYELVSHDKNLTVETFGNIDKSIDDIKIEAVGIIAFNQDFSRIVLEKEYRLACNDWVYNFPGGMVDEGENYYTTAERELREETGLQLVKIVDVLPPSYSAVGFTDETISTIICVATGEFSESTSPDEEIEVDMYTKEEVKELLKTGMMSMRTQTFLYCWVNGFNSNTLWEDKK